VRDDSLGKSYSYAWGHTIQASVTYMSGDSHAPNKNAKGGGS